MCHVYVRADGLGATAVVNEDYPDRVAFTLLNTILDEFVSVHGDKWQGQTVDDCLPLYALIACLCCTTNGGVAAVVAAVVDEAAGPRPPPVHRYTIERVVILRSRRGSEGRRSGARGHVWTSSWLAYDRTVHELSGRTLAH